MDYLKAKKQFEIRYYLWAMSEFDKELKESFPSLRLFKTGADWEMLLFMQELTPNEQIVLAKGLLKRFHPSAVSALGERMSAEEILLLARRDIFPGGRSGLEAEVLARALANEPIKFASKKTLRKAITAKFVEEFGNGCLGIYLEEEPNLLFSMKICGWKVNTFFDFGRKDTIVKYSHNIVSETSYKVNDGEMYMVMGFQMSLNSLLGIASQTQWSLITKENVESTCNSVIKLCGRFFEVLPKLLKGLECEKVVPPTS